MFERPEKIKPNKASSTQQIMTGLSAGGAVKLQQVQAQMQTASCPFALLKIK